MDFIIKEARRVLSEYSQTLNKSCTVEEQGVLKRYVDLMEAASQNYHNLPRLPVKDRKDLFDELQKIELLQQYPIENQITCCVEDTDLHP